MRLINKAVAGVWKHDNIHFTLNHSLTFKLTRPVANVVRVQPDVVLYIQKFNNWSARNKAEFRANGQPTYAGE